MRFSLAISHTPWIPARVESMKRLMASLEMPGYEDHANFAWTGAPDAFAVFSDKEPNHVWSAKMWAWAAEQDVEWCVFLQDDTRVAPRFFHRLGAVILRSTSPIIGLQVPHPAAPLLAEEGVEGFTTSDMLIGVGYAVRRDILVDFLKWRAALTSGAVEAISEDSLLGLYAMTMSRRVYHPIPTLVDHDVDIESTYGNQDHPNRRSRVTWENGVFGADEGWFDLRAPHLGRFYDSSPDLALKWVPGVSAADHARFKADTAPGERRRIHYARLGRGEPPKAKLFVAIPTRGTISAQCARSVFQLFQDPAMLLTDSLEIADCQMWEADVVRVRNRFAHHFLYETDATHLLFLDDDVEVLPTAIRGMLDTGKGFVATPYPRRMGVDWDRVAEGGDVHPEARAYRYSVRPLDDKFRIETDGTAEVEAMPLGCALISRDKLRRLSDKAPRYIDTRTDGTRIPTANLFGLLMVGNGEEPVPSPYSVSEQTYGGLLSEDYSFCARWRANGGKVYMYLGEGSPATHHGHHAYRGHIEAFNLRRVQK